MDAASDGSIEVKYFDPGKLVPAFEIHDAVSSGKIEAGYTAPVYLAGKLPATELFTYIPFGVDAPACIGWFYSGNGMKLYQEAYDSAGYKIKPFLFKMLTPETAGWFRKAINKQEDLKGMAIRYPGLPGKVLQKLGASISMVPGSEIYQSLEKGAIDGTEFSNPAIDQKLGFFKVAKYNYFPGWHQPATNLELVINKDTWNKMSPRQKAVIELAVRAGRYHLHPGQVNGGPRRGDCRKRQGRCHQRGLLPGDARSFQKDMEFGDRGRDGQGSHA